jgi:hypothetical protein
MSAPEDPRFSRHRLTSLSSYLKLCVGPNGCNCIGFVVNVVLVQKWAEGR